MKRNPNSDPREKLRNISPDLRAIHTNTLALRLVVEQMQKEMLTEVHLAYQAQDGRVDNAKAAMFSLVRTEFSMPFANAEALLRLLENSEEFQNAAKIIEPLLDQVAQIEAEEEKARQEKFIAERDLADARKAAAKRALDQVDKDSAVMAAAKRLKDLVGL